MAAAPVVGPDAAALEASDGYLPALLGRTRLEVASGQHGPHTLEALDDIALRGDQEWREWAVRWRGKIGERGER